MAFAFSISGCGGGDSKYEGSYRGSSDRTVLTLESGGSASYSQQMKRGLEAGDGTWRVEDDKLIVDVEPLDYEIYADVSDSPESLLFKSENSKWNDEIFTKK